MRGAGIDLASVMACSQAVAGIPKRETRRMVLVKSCKGYTSVWQSSGGQAQRVTENFFAKALCFCPSSATTSQFSPEILSR